MGDYLILAGQDEKVLDVFFLGFMDFSVKFCLSHLKFFKSLSISF